MTGKEQEPWIWWKHGVIYHIYPRSFQDDNGDGVGDIRGIIRRLGYLRDLGIDGIWISPMYRSPMVDFGYDVSDYRSIDPVFGSMDDFRELLQKAHDMGIRVILDMILNHTSNQHPWFIESSSSLTNPKRNWYIWHAGVMGHEPNNWKSAVGGSAWKFDPSTGEYYLHSFFREQPDLNWRDPEMPEAFFDEIRYWLDMGVDGFRLDVINLIAKDKKFRNNPALPGLSAWQQQIYTRNRKRSVTIVKQLRKLLDTYDDRVSIGEIYTQPPGDAKTVAKYLARGTNGIHLAFDFTLIFSRWNAHSYYKSIRKWYDSLPADGWPCHVLSNHDLLRSIDRYPWRTHKEEKAKVAAVLLLTLRGTPFIYYGEEIGMHNSRLSRSQIHDPLGKKYWPLFSGRDQARTPMQWNNEPHGGFTTGRPWLRLNKDHAVRNVKMQEGDHLSLLNLYRNLIRLRHQTPALQHGSWLCTDNGKQGLLAYIRTSGNERILVVLNFTGQKRKFSLPEYICGQILLSTHRSSDEYCYFQKMQISPFEATICRISE